MTVTCTSCKAETTVPFTPTPGRPVFCRDCFRKRSNAPGGPPQRTGGFGGAPGGGFSRGPPQQMRQPKKAMLAQGRKAHFVYDSLAALGAEGKLDESQRRMFIEMLFTRGSRQSTEAAQEFLEAKLNDETITFEEAQRLSRLLDRYSFRR
ncbi:MAG TPA: CxxC-x17-CxxC domain-containing protein [Candidatus Thermoplasmatota archaeon]|nr:CxxC-x17-CxxC domain-containing protein [Candidatus Thermoplasmatota archaeon]